MSNLPGVPHPDDERLSAFIDGEADLDGHESCPECATRIDQLRRVAAWVASPPSRVPDLEPVLAEAVGAAAAEPARPISMKPRRLVAGLALAAVVAVVFGSVSLLAGLRGEPDSDDVAGSAARDSVVEGGDLGEWNDPMALATAVAPAITGEAADFGTGASKGGTELEAVGPMSAPAGAGQPTADDSAASGAAAGSEGAPPAPTTRAAQPEAFNNTRSSARSSPTGKTCLSQSGAASGGGVLVYRATARWKGTPAVVLGYRLTGRLAHRLVVMSRADCSLLVVQSF